MLPPAIRSHPAPSGPVRRRSSCRGGAAGAGNLRFEVSTDVSNVVAEPGTAELNNLGSSAQLAELTPYPDLQVASLAVEPAGAWVEGQNVTLRWRDNNAGDAPINAAWTDRVLVRNASTGATVATADLRYDPAAAGAGAVAAGGFRDRSFSFAWPAGAVGGGRFVFEVATDAGTEIFESNVADNAEANNTASLSIVSAPDLTVGGLAITPVSPSAGSNLVISWVDSNGGVARTPAGWNDRIIVRNRDRGETLLDTAVFYDPSANGNAPLAPGESVARSTTFRLPDGARGAGNLEVEVIADQNASGQSLLAEFTAAGADGEGNNAATLQFTSTASLYANLVASGLSAPAAGRGGDVITVGWRIDNVGGVATPASWSDRIVLSQNSVIGDADDITLATAIHSGVLDPRTGYAASRDVSLPLNTEGNYYIGLVADVLKEVNEPDTRADNTSGPRAITLTAPAADLVVEVVTAPASAQSGQSIDVAWRVRNQGDFAATGGWRDAVYLSQDATLDGADVLLGTFARSASLAIDQTYSASGKFKLPFETTGEFRILVSTDIDNAVFEHGAASNNVGASVGTLAISAAPAADLEASAVSAPASALAGASVTVSWTLANRGEAPVFAPWVDRVYLSSDGTMAGATLLGSLTHSTSLAIGASQNFSLPVTLPLIADGNFRLLVASDADGQVYEARREANNTAASAATIALQHRDLTVSALSAPASAVSGSVVRIDRTVSNAGSAAVAGSWTDRFYLSRNAVVDAGDRLLAEVAAGGTYAAGAGYGGPIDLTLPIDVSGNWFVIAVTDATDTVAELNAENNNARAAAIDIALAPYADLSVSTVVAPTLLIADPARVKVEWTVINSGTGIGQTLQWTDSVVLSRDNGEQFVLGTFDHSGALAVGDSYSRSETMFAPASLTGHFKVTVRTDSKGVVFENDSEANNAAAAREPLDVMPIPYADLHVTALEVPAAGRSSAPLTVTWTVRNDGIGPTNTSNWSDLLRLTRDAAGVQTLATVAADHLGVLEVGGSYVRSASITVPDGYSGPLYVALGTGGPFEFTHGDDNLAISGPVQIALAPSPDLQVTEITAPATADEGATIEITWTVANNGEARAAGSWRDIVTLRKLSATPGQPVTLGSFEYSVGLGAGLSYTRTERFSLPAKIEGAWQVTVSTDTGNTVYEGAGEANNSTGDDRPIVLSLKARPDLQVQTITAPDRVQAGATAAVSFVIVNRGSVPTDQPHWRDNIYLSLDNKPGADDILIGSIENGAALAPNEAYTSTTSSIVIPERFRGPGYFLVIADASGNIDEYPAANEANNLIAKEIYVVPQPLADLVTGGVVAPAQAVYGSEIEVRYTVTNKGSDTTNRAGWTDTVWLTRDKTRPNPGGNGGIQLGSFAHSGALAVGESYEQVVRVRIPQQIASGIYYITPWSDAYDAVFEDTLASNLNPDDPNEFDNNNYKARSIDIIGTPVPPKPDVQVTAITTNAPGSVDEPFSVTWTVANRGEGKASGSWYDTILVHDLPDYRASGAQVWNIGTFERGTELDSLATYTETQKIDLAPSVRGRYVTVITDSLPPPAPSLDESIETNNALTVAAEVIARAADLKVVSVSAPAQNFSGEKTTVSWTVRNDGAAVWSGTRIWTDVVYFSPDPVFIVERATIVGVKAHANTGGLAAGASYSETVDVVLPKGLGGDYFLYVATDDAPRNGQPDLSPEARNGENERSRQVYGVRVYEDVAQVNNLTRGEIPVTYREPDLKISQLTIPAGELRSGQTISVSFTVANQGTRETREDYWIDRLYLSRDPSLDSRDLQVGEFQRYGRLAVGASYDRTATFTLPGDADGPFYLIAFTDSDVVGSQGEGSASPIEVGKVRLQNDQVEEFRDEGNNRTVAPVTVKLSPAADLRVTTLTAPERVEVGQILHIAYTVGNLGGAATSAGAWTDQHLPLGRRLFRPHRRPLRRHRRTHRPAAGRRQLPGRDRLAPRARPGRPVLRLRSHRRAGWRRGAARQGLRIDRGKQQHDGVGEPGADRAAAAVGPRGQQHRPAAARDERLSGAHRLHRHQLVGDRRGRFVERFAVSVCRQPMGPHRHPARQGRAFGRPGRWRELRRRAAVEAAAGQGRPVPDHRSHRHLQRGL